MGRPRGGLTARIHLSLVITVGRRGNSPQFQAVLEAIAVPRPDRVLAGKARGSRANRAYLRRRGIAATIPGQAGRIRHRKAEGSGTAPGRVGRGPPDCLSAHSLSRAATVRRLPGRFE